jgi:hypothetical protein
LGNGGYAAGEVIVLANIFGTGILAGADIHLELTRERDLHFSGARK